MIKHKCEDSTQQTSVSWQKQDINSSLSSSNKNKRKTNKEFRDEYKVREDQIIFLTCFPLQGNKLGLLQTTIYKSS